MHDTFYAKTKLVMASPDIFLQTGVDTWLDAQTSSDFLNLTFDELIESAGSIGPKDCAVFPNQGFLESSQPAVGPTQNSSLCDNDEFMNEFIDLDNGSEVMDLDNSVGSHIAPTDLMNQGNTMDPAISMASSVYTRPTPYPIPPTSSMTMAKPPSASSALPAKSIVPTGSTFPAVPAVSGPSAAYSYPQSGYHIIPVLSGSMQLTGMPYWPSIQSASPSVAGYLQNPAAASKPDYTSSLSFPQQDASKPRPTGQKQKFEFVELTVPSDFVENPNNHGRWEIDSSGKRHYLNAPKDKRRKRQKI